MKFIMWIVALGSLAVTIAVVGLVIFFVAGFCIAIRSGDSPFGGDTALGLHGPYYFAHHAVPKATPRWTPDGQNIMTPLGSYGDYGRIYIVRTDGSEFRLFSEGGDKNKLDRFPNLSPDGTRIAYATSRHTKAPIVTEIETANLDGSNRRRLTERISKYHTAIAPDWSPDGSRIAFADGFADDSWFPNIRVIASDGSQEERLLYHTHTNTPEYWPDGKRTNSKDITVGPIWSPSEQELAFVVESVIDGSEAYRSELYIVGADGQELRRLFLSANFQDQTQVRGRIIGPSAWSSNGQRLAFLFLENPTNIGNSGSLSLYTINSDGTELDKITKVENRIGGSIAVLEWSPDDSQFLFSWSGYQGSNGRYHTSIGSIYVVNVDGTNLQEISSGTFASWSPNGSRIAVVQPDQSGPSDVLKTIAPDGSDIRVLVTRDEDGRYLPGNPG